MRMMRMMMRRVRGRGIRRWIRAERQWDREGAAK